MARDPTHDVANKINPLEVWNDITLTRARVDELIEQSQQDGDLKPVRAALDELQLKTSNYKKLLEEMQAPIQAVLGKHFLGTAEWQQGFGVRVGPPPPIPECLTVEFLNAGCSLHPGETIKETHILMLMPKTVAGEPYSARKLAELCATRIGAADRHILGVEPWANEWKALAWANLPQFESEWVLIPKSDPDPARVPQDKHFRDKMIEAQQQVHRAHYSEYREAGALEVMTTAILYYLTQKERVFPDYLRCKELSARGERVCVGYFSLLGLQIYDDREVSKADDFGLALARKL